MYVIFLCEILIISANNYISYLNISTFYSKSIQFVIIHVKERVFNIEITIANILAPKNTSFMFNLKIKHAKQNRDKTCRTKQIFQVQLLTIRLIFHIFIIIKKYFLHLRLTKR